MLTGAGGFFSSGGNINALKDSAAYVKVGLSPDGGVTHFLRSAMPRQLVNELCIAAKSQARCTRWGLIMGQPIFRGAPERVILPDSAIGTHS